MSAGERSVLRLSAALSKLQGALVLIDEIETGLHPFIQQQLMYAADVQIGRDTGKHEFPTYLKALARFDLLGSFVFLLDGDARDLEPDLIAAARTVSKVLSPPAIVFLPGDSAPEKWIWQCLQDHTSEYAAEFSIPADALEAQLKRLVNFYDAASDKETNKIKERFYLLCNDFLKRERSQVARVIGKKEALRGELYKVTQLLEDAVRNWRSQRP